jgi:hypothetical protein
MNDYPSWSWIECIDDYKDVKEPEKWSKCLKCNLIPKIWEFDNGRQTACGCWKSKYDHFTIYAESICSVYSRTKSTMEYDSNGLKNNWNHYCQTGEIVFDRPKGGRLDKRW